jgi:SNF2 family DNA or RNA helicase
MLSFKTAKLDKNRQMIVLRFPQTNTHLVEKITTLPNVQMSYQFWEVPVSEKVISKLKSWGFELCTSLLRWKDDMFEKQVVTPTYTKEENGSKLYKFQQEGVSFIDNKQGRALIADEMGLGKTVQALNWLHVHPEIRPVLIICPSSVKINWSRETKKWVTDSKVQIIEGETPKKINGNIVIINYEILSYWNQRLRNYHFKAMIIDEAHYIKNPTAKRTKAIKSLNKSIPNVIGLTGTPIENRPVEIYNIIQIINPSIFPNYYSYLHRFCGAKRNKYGGLDKMGSSNEKELNRILRNTIMIRRKKSEVLKELPPKMTVKVPLELTNKTEYKRAELQFIQFVKEKYGNIDDKIEDELKTFAKRYKIDINEEASDEQLKELADLKIEKVSKAPALAKIEALKQLAVEGKLKEIINWMDTFLESGEKLVVFAVHKKVISALMQAFPKALKIDGSVSNKKRQEIMDEFQSNEDSKLIIANIKAGGVGITLTAASNVAIIQFPWSPSVVNQAVDRVHRITQLHQVTAWMLVGEDTIEEKILEILKKKEAIISKAIDGEDYEDTSVFMELIESYKKISKR